MWKKKRWRGEKQNRAALDRIDVGQMIKELNPVREREKEQEGKMRTMRNI